MSGVFGVLLIIIIQLKGVMNGLDKILPILHTMTFYFIQIKIVLLHTNTGKKELRIHGANAMHLCLCVTSAHD